MAEKQKSVFDTLNAINVNERTEKKGNLTYLSWAWAWGEVKKAYPDAHYEIWKNENNLPYVYDPQTGFMVYTSVTIGNVTHEMWLPVMDGANKAMKATPYKYSTRYGDKTCEAASMMDINKTIMRCLVKNLAMFGLGLYIYAGEDLPEEEANAKKQEKANEPLPEPIGEPGAVSGKHIDGFDADGKPVYTQYVSPAEKAFGSKHNTVTSAVSTVDTVPGW